MEILQPGFESLVRSLLGVDEIELPDEELNSIIYEELAEANIKSRVADYATITDASDLIYIQNATLYQICYLVCPSLSRRLDISVSTMETKWTKDKVDWSKKASEYLGNVELMLSKITSVTVVQQEEVSLVDYISNTRNPIGGLTS